MANAVRWQANNMEVGQSHGTWFETNLILMEEEYDALGRQHCLPIAVEKSMVELLGEEHDFAEEVELISLVDYEAQCRARAAGESNG